MDVQIIRKKISFQELKEIAALNYGHMIKGVVDLRQKIIALGVNSTPMVNLCCLRRALHKWTSGVLIFILINCGRTVLNLLP